MPIKDLQRNKPGLARAGVIRLGYKVKKCKGCKAVNLATNEKCDKCGKSEFVKRKQGEQWVENTYPTPADHFVLTDAPGVAENIKNPKPTELNIFFPFDTIDENFPAYHQYWVASALVCRGDGENVLYAINPQSGQTVVRDGRAMQDFERGTNGKKINFKSGDRVACPGMAHDLYGACEHCKPNAMLLVLLRNVPRLAYYQIATTSIHNIVGLTEQMTYISDTIGRLTNGKTHLQGVPFILKLAPRDISVPGKDGGRMRTEKHLLSLEVEPEWMGQLIGSQQQMANPAHYLVSGNSEAKPKEANSLPQDDVIEADYSHVDPPVWIPPNGGDDSGEPAEDELEPPDYQTEFTTKVITEIPWYQNQTHVLSTVEALKVGPITEDTSEMVFNELEKHANTEADKTAT